MTTHFPVAPLHLSERQEGEFLGVSERTLQDWRGKRVGPIYCKLGKRVVYDVRDLGAFVAARRVEPKAA